jgi:integrase
MADATPTAPAPIHPLRERLIKDLELRGFIRATQVAYIRAIRNCLAYVKKRPEDLNVEDARAFLLHLQRQGYSVGTINSASVALRFFMRVTLGQSFAIERVPIIREAKKIPIVLTPEEVTRLLLMAPGLKYRAALSVAYGAGLRASEVVNLKVSDIDSERMVIRVENGKRNKDRLAKLSPALLSLLRDWWVQCRSKVWLFPSRNGAMRHITARQFADSGLMTPTIPGN